MNLVDAINNIHGAISRADLFNAIRDLLVDFGFAGGFVILYSNESRSRLELSDFYGVTEDDACAVEKALADRFPLTAPHTFSISEDNSFLCGGLVFDSSPYGGIAFALKPGELAPDMDGLDAIFQAISIALIKLQIYEEANNKINSSTSKIDAINHVASLLRNLDLDPLLSNLLEIALNIMKAEVGSILLYNEDEQLESRIEMGVSESFLLSLRDREGAPFIERMIDEGRPVLINDAKNDDRIDLTHVDRNVKSIICLPLITKTQKSGVIVVVNYVDSFQKSDFEILSTIDFLASSAIENTILRMKQAENDRLRQQMVLARQIQESLQAQNIPDFKGVDLDGWCLPCYETGGDYFDFIEFNDHELALVIGDASGHGLGAALMMVGTRASMLSLFQLGLPITEVFHEINNRIEADSQAERFMTLFCGLINAEKKTLRYCSAGHDTPLLYRPETDEIIELESTGIPLGMFADITYEQSDEIALHSGDVLVMTTDGVREAFNESGEAFGDERFVDLVRSIGSRGLSAPEISMEIRNVILNYIHPAPRTDDITVIVAVIE